MEIFDHCVFYIDLFAKVCNHCLIRIAIRRMNIILTRQMIHLCHLLMTELRSDSVINHPITEDFELEYNNDH